MTFKDKLRNYLYSFTHTKQWIDFRARVTGKTVVDIVKTFYGNIEKKDQLVGNIIFLKAEEHTVIRRIFLKEIKVVSFKNCERHDVHFQIEKVEHFKPVKECTFEEYLDIYWPYFKRLHKY